MERRVSIPAVGVDLEDDSCHKPILQTLGDQKLQLLFVVAGLQYYDTLQTIDRKQVRQQFEVNALGPLFLVQALQHTLAESAKVSWRWRLLATASNSSVLTAGHTLSQSAYCVLQVVLLASRMGSLTQVDFTNGDVVSD